MSSLVRVLRNIWPALTLAITLVTGCRRTPAPAPVSLSIKAAPQILTAPVENSSIKECGLGACPASRSNQEIVADAPNGKKAPSPNMFIKLAIDEGRRITHIRVLGLAHSNALNWKGINETALDSVRRFHYRPAMYEGKPVVVCGDASVIVDLF